MVRSSLWSALLLVLLLAGGHETLAISRTLGVAPADKAMYEAQEFSCKDGSQKIPATSINDDYCDCSDGSDEPGTSACSNGVFSCVNKGHKSVLIYSSRINDGVCDCCDGSDEYNGWVKCEDTCEQEGAEIRRDLQTFIKMQELGLARRENYVKSADEKRKELLERVQKHTDTLSTKEPLLNAARENRERVQKIVDDETEARRRELEEKNKAKEIIEEQRALEMQNAAQEGSQAAAEGAPAEGGEIPPQVVEGAAPKTPDGEGGHPDGSVPYEAYDDEYPEGYHPEDDGGDIEEGAGAEEAAATDSGAQPAAEKSAHEVELEELRKIERELEKETNAVKREKDAADEVLKIDFGKDGAFLALYDKCYEANIQQYTYELCMFKGTKQKEGGSSQNLGKWGEWANDKMVMHYQHGGSCWNGPARSTKVTLICGEDEFLSSVTEPSKCVYEMEFFTPLACSAELALEAKQELERMTGVPHH